MIRQDETNLFNFPGTTHADTGTTERAAAERIAPIREKLIVMVLRWFREAGPRGLTKPEAGAKWAEILGEQPSARREYSIRPRVTELAAAGYVAEAGGSREESKVWIWTGKPGDGAEVKPAHNAKRGEAVGVWFVSAVSGIRYRRRGSAGDLSSVIVDGITYRPAGS